MAGKSAIFCFWSGRSWVFLRLPFVVGYGFSALSSHCLMGRVVLVVFVVWPWEAKVMTGMIASVASTILFAFCIWSCVQVEGSNPAEVM